LVLGNREYGPHSAVDRTSIDPPAFRRHWIAIRMLRRAIVERLRPTIKSPEGASALQGLPGGRIPARHLVALDQLKAGAQYEDHGAPMAARLKPYAVDCPTHEAMLNKGNRLSFLKRTMTRDTRVNELDLLRLIAALSVVFFHYSFRGFAADDMSIMPYPLLAPYAMYGNLGVELFFMISGFVILMTAAGGRLREFVVSRIVRLYPAFWICCTLTFVLTLLIGEPRFSATTGQYLINMTMLSGFFGVPSIDGAYWSLFVELRFYALVAIVLFIGKIRSAQTLLFFWLLASIALEFEPQVTLRSLLIVDHSAFFIAGATCFIVWSGGLSAARLLMLSGSWALAVYQSLRALPEFEDYYEVAANAWAVAAIVTAFFGVMLLVALRRTGAIGRRRWLLAGAMTYPLYLLHQRIGYMIFNAFYPGVSAHLLLWGCIVAMLGVALAVQVFMERPFARLLRKAIDRGADRIVRIFPSSRRGQNSSTAEPSPRDPIATANFPKVASPPSEEPLEAG
jgi:peptidoglycan/LPS O-acetylase OafA/YrhL